MHKKLYLGNKKFNLCAFVLFNKEWRVFFVRSSVAQVALVVLRLNEERTTANSRANAVCVVVGWAVSRMHSSSQLSVS